MAARSKNLLSRDLFLNVVRLHDRLSTEFTSLFRRSGLTVAQYNVLRIVMGGPREGVSCQHITANLLTRVPDVTRLIDRMVKSELVRRARSESDRRVVLVCITPAGRRLCESLAQPVMDLHRAQFEVLSLRELESLNDALEAVLGAR